MADDPKDPPKNPFDDLFGEPFPQGVTEDDLTQNALYDSQDFYDDDWWGDEWDDGGWGDAQCACKHIREEHVTWTTKEEFDTEACSKCPCKYFTEDNLEWLLKNKSKS